MQTAKSNIKFLCLASADYEKSIVNLFNKLDISFTPLLYENWINNQNKLQDDLTVLALPEGEIDLELFKTILRFSNRNYFIIFFSPLINNTISILTTCNDCCSWPCDPLEFSFRINRFASTHPISSALGGFDMDMAEWRNLNLIGKSSIFIDTLSFIKNACNCDAPILIESETGCGKEVTARALHNLGNRKGHPFIALNCGAIPDQLIENELFGHEKGAYTDAKHNLTGLAEQANGGTLFLDEIEALSSKGQVTLLRFIEDKLVRPLGAERCKKVDVRIIAASNVSLSELVTKGGFRQDLLFRINLLHLRLPPLRDRREDIQIIAEHFMEKFRQQYQQPHKYFHSDTLTWMFEYHWPGNVRELENFVHRSFLLSQVSEIRSTPICHENNQAYSRRKLFDRRQRFTFDKEFNVAKNQAINHFEQAYLTWLISSSNGNVTQAADKARKERRALGKLLKKHSISPDCFRHK